MSDTEPVLTIVRSRSHRWQIRAVCLCFVASFFVLPDEFAYRTILPGPTEEVAVAADPSTLDEPATNQALATPEPETRTHLSQGAGRRTKSPAATRVLAIPTPTPAIPTPLPATAAPLLATPKPTPATATPTPEPAAPSKSTATPPGGSTRSVNGTFAEPSGPQVPVGLGPAELVAAIETLHGPSVDVGATVARLVPFPAGLPSLPDADIIGIWATLSATELVALSELQVAQTRVGYVTSASLDAAEQIFIDELTGDGWKIETQTREERYGGEQIHLSFASDPERHAADVHSPINVFLSDRDGITRVDMRVSVMAADPVAAARFTDWYDDGLPAEQTGEVRRVWIRVDTEPNSPGTVVQMDAAVRFAGATIASLEALVPDGFAAHPDWSSIEPVAEQDLPGDVDLAFTTDFGPLDGTANLNLTERGLGEGFVDLDVNLFAVVFQD